jgi:hypothetical protein
MRTLISIIFLSLILSNCSENKTVDITTEKTTAKLSDSVLWKPIKLKSWESTPSINHRTATEDDVKNGSAIYCINKADHEPYNIQLPKLAYLTNSESKKKELVVVIQIESTSKDTVAGYRYINGGFGASLLYELQFLDAEVVKKVVSK